MVIHVHRLTNNLILHKPHLYPSRWLSITSLSEHAQRSDISAVRLSDRVRALRVLPATATLRHIAPDSVLPAPTASPPTRTISQSRTKLASLHRPKTMPRRAAPVCDRGRHPLRCACIADSGGGGKMRRECGRGSKAGKRALQGWKTGTKRRLESGPLSGI